MSGSAGGGCPNCHAEGGVADSARSGTAFSSALGSGEQGSFSSGNDSVSVGKKLKGLLHGLAAVPEWDASGRRANGNGNGAGLRNGGGGAVGMAGVALADGGGADVHDGCGCD